MTVLTGEFRSPSMVLNCAISSATDPMISTAAIPQ